MRGYNLSDLAEEGYSFSDAMFVLFQGRIPTEAEEKMLTLRAWAAFSSTPCRPRRARRSPSPRGAPTCPPRWRPA